MLLSFTCKDNEEYGSHGRNQPDHNEQARMSVLCDEGKYRSSITGRQECQECVPDNSSQS